MERKKTEVMVSVLANQFCGKTTNPKTAERISRMYGKYDQAFESVSRSSSASDTSPDILLEVQPRARV